MVRITVPGKNFAENPPVSFLYGGEAFDAAVWQKTVAELPQERRGQAVTQVNFTAPDGKLRLELTGKYTEKYQVVELTPVLRNLSDTEPTQRISGFQSLDLQWNGAGEAGASLLTYADELTSVKVRRQYGSQRTLFDFVPADVMLAPCPTHDRCILSASRGSGSNDWLPFFGVDVCETYRFNFAVGWSGAWRAEIRTAKGVLSVRIGLAETDFPLEPGESVEFPTVAIHAFSGEDEAMWNDFRQYALEYRLPRDSKENLLIPPRTMMFSGTVPNEKLLQFVETIRREKIALDSIWVDAGWYGEDRDVALELHESDWEWTVGDWRFNQKIHPGGLRPVSDAAHQAGLKIHLWIEMERAVKSSRIVREHPDWFLETEGKSCMLNLAVPAACDYAIETVSRIIRSEAIDCYREDFNFDTIPFWRTGDEALGVKGLTEIRFINGFWRFWRTLRRNFPDLLIDNCASGGRRIDWMTLSLSIPMWRSDFACAVSAHNCESNQMLTAYLSRWIPFHSGGHMLVPGLDYDYASASVTTSIFNNADRYWFHDGLDTPAARKIFRNMKKRAKIGGRIRECCLGNYHMLTAEPEKLSNPFAVQFHLPKKNRGVVIAFRRPRTETSAVRLSLRELKLQKRYLVERPGNSGVMEMTGGELQNWEIRLPRRRSAAIFFYQEAEK